MIRLISDVHGARAFLARTAAEPGPLLILGDLINYVDYRTYEGILADIAGKDFVRRWVELRTAGDSDGTRAMWRGFAGGRGDEVRQQFEVAVEDAYVDICGVLDGTEAYVTFGNVDRPAVLERTLPASCTYVEAGVIELNGQSIGIVGGGLMSVGTPGEITDEQMAERLDELGAVDILCTHVPPAVGPLATDVVGGRMKGSAAVRRYLTTHRPRFHYFGDIHQPQAQTWVVEDTRCVNVGYYRATGKVVHHG